MKIVVAPDSFKECLSAGEVASAIASGILSVCPEAEVSCVPLSDGGEGMTNILTERLGAERVSVPVTGPIGETVSASYGRGGDTAILDVASACGIQLVPPDRKDPLIATSRGVGELIAAAVRGGCDELVIGLGGSATCDGGEGMMAVPGLRDLTAGVRIHALCDVDNPFVGPRGAARVFGPQKGAGPEAVEILEERMRNHALRILSETGTDVTDMRGAGAAGGLGGALHAYLGAELVSGIGAVLDLVGFDKEIVDADYIITGEGASDLQTLSGKVPIGVLRRSGVVPVFLVSGRIRDREALQGAGFSGLFQVTPDSVPTSEAVRPDVARRNLSQASARLCREVLMNAHLSSWARRRI
ncbi:MAG: glycerate kinase [Bacteroidales bacterium]|nr:glycerate kinase [Bacteroidales bacterium]